MEWKKTIIGGLAGAVVLTTLHQVLQKLITAAPRLDLVGEEALEKLLTKGNLQPPRGKTLFVTTLAGDIVSNAMYYSAIGLSKSKHLMATGVTLGLAAGFGALTLTQPLGLNDQPVNRQKLTQWLTVSLYTLGGVVSAVTIKALRERSRRFDPKFS